MYAVVKIADQQFRVQSDERLIVPRLDGEAGGKVEFSQVLLYSNGEDVRIGTPVVEGCHVAAEIVRQGRGRKIVVFKKKRRKNYRRKRGHRQLFTEIRITGIQAV